jgi:hypothetical protein
VQTVGPVLACLDAGFVDAPVVHRVVELLPELVGHRRNGACDAAGVGRQIQSDLEGEALSHDGIHAILEGHEVRTDGFGRLHDLGTLAAEVQCEGVDVAGRLRHPQANRVGREERALLDGGNGSTDILGDEVVPAGVHHGHLCRDVVRRCSEATGLIVGLLQHELDDGHRLGVLLGRSGRGVQTQRGDLGVHVNLLDRNTKLLDGVALASHRGGDGEECVLWPLAEGEGHVGCSLQELDR